jgi:hypothetical protein
MGDRRMVAVMVLMLGVEVEWKRWSNIVIYLMMMRYSNKVTTVLQSCFSSQAPILQDWEYIQKF